MSIKIRVLQFKRGLLDRLTAAGILPGEPAIAWDDDTKPRLLIGDRMGVPRELAAPAHVHLIANITGLQAALDAKAWGGGGIAWSQLTDIPGVAAFTNDAGYLTGITNVMVTAALGFTPAHAAHGHAIADVTGLDAALGGKAAAVHTHAFGDVPGLQTGLDGKAAAVHSHVVADTTGLQAALDAKAAATHAAAHAPGGADALPWTTIHGRGTTAAKPAPSAANAGYTYFDTDLGKQQRSTGAAWEDCEGASGVSGGGATGYPSFPIDTPPSTPNTFDDEFNGSTLNAAWTKVDANNTISVANGKLLLSGTGAVDAVIKKSITRPFCIIAKFTQAGLVSPSYANIFLYHGATNGNYYSVGFQGRATVQNNALSIQSQRFNSNGTWVNEIFWPACPHVTIYVKIEDNGTTLTQSLSSDGIVWQIIRSEPYYAWCVVDWVGIGSNGANGYPFAFYCDWIRRIY